jgi:hypothetical protein
VALGRVPPSLSVSLHQCSVFIVTLILICSEGQAGEVWELANRNDLVYRGRGVLDRTSRHGTGVHRCAAIGPAEVLIGTSCCSSTGSYCLLPADTTRTGRIVLRWKQAVSESVSQSVRQSVSQPVRHSVSQSGIQSVSQSGIQSVSQSVSQSDSQPVSQSVSQAFRQSVSQSVRQSVSQSVSQSVRHKNRWKISRATKHPY